MSYDPTEWAPQNPGQPPAQPPVTPPTYGQAPQPPAQPAYGQAPQPEYPSMPPTAYGQPQQPQQPQYGTPGSPSQPQYGQQPQPQYGTPSSPSQPQYGQPQPQYGTPSSPSLPQYGQQPQAPQYGTPSNPSLPPYGQPQYGTPSSPALPQYGQPSQPGYGQPGSPSQPQYGQPSSPTYPAYGEQAAPVYGAPGAPMFGAPAALPGYVPPAAPPRKSGAKLWIIILVVVIVLAGGGGGGYAYWLSTRPKPVITLTSQYLDGATAVGASATSLTLKGTDFTASSAITFLLDGAALPGATPVQSDSNGAVNATLAVTSDWSVGTHTITAKDAAGYLTKLGVKVEIVTPGKTGTPGPNGAPTDNANMTINANVTVSSSSATITLTVKNGSVCSADDDGQPHTTHNTASNGVTYAETMSLTCSGTYQGGKLTYTETASGLNIVYSDGLDCQVKTPFVNRHLDGTFTNGTTLGGTYSNDAVTLDCNLGVGSLPVAAEQGTWTGLAVAS